MSKIILAHKILSAECRIDSALGQRRLRLAICGRIPLRDVADDVYETALGAQVKAAARSYDCASIECPGCPRQ